MLAWSSMLRSASDDKCWTLRKGFRLAGLDRGVNDVCTGLPLRRARREVRSTRGMLLTISHHGVITEGVIPGSALRLRRASR